MMNRALMRKAQVQSKVDELEITWVPVATGDDAPSFFINNSGELAAWICQRGDRRIPEEKQLRHRSVLGGVKFVSVTASTDQNSQFVALVSDLGQVFTWGSGAWGRLGHGNTHDNDFPMPIVALNRYRVIFVAADNHCLAVTDSGMVFSWGLNTYGQCGHPPFTADVNILQPRRIPIPYVRRWQPASVVHASVGHTHSLLVSACGKLYAFGSNLQGMLGDGSLSDCADPTEVILPGKCIAAAAGMAHSLALTEDGNVFAWGLDHLGELGVVVPGKRVDMHPFSTPTQAEARDIRDIHVATGELIQYAESQLPSVGIRPMIDGAPRDGVFYHATQQRWTPWAGDVPSGVRVVDVPQPINRTFTLTPVHTHAFTPKQVHHLHRVISVSAFENASCAVTRDGELFTWGTRRGVTRNQPTCVLDGNVIAASISNSNNIAVMADGKVFQWFEPEIEYGSTEGRRIRRERDRRASKPKHIYTFSPR